LYVSWQAGQLRAKRLTHRAYR